MTTLFRVENKGPKDITVRQFANNGDVPSTTRKENPYPPRTLSPGEGVESYLHSGNYFIVEEGGLDEQGEPDASVSG